MEHFIFCPTCQTYLGPSLPTCYCGWQRPAHERLPAPGQPLWKAILGGPARGRAVVAGNLVLFGWGNRQYGGGVSALERFTGEPVWHVNTNHAVEGGLLVTQDKVLFGTLGFLGHDAELLCCSLQEGSILWKKALMGGTWAIPVILEERVYVGCDNGHIYCFDLRSGEQVSRWPAMLPAGRNWLALAENKLYVLTQSGSLFAVDLYSAHKTEIAKMNEEFKSGLAVGANHLFAGSVGGNLYAINLHNHRARLVMENAKGIVAAPYYEAGFLYLGSKDHYLHVFNEQSEQKAWKFDCVNSVASTPIVQAGLVFVGSNSGHLYAIERDSGVLAWKFASLGQAPVMANPTYFDGLVYFGAEKGDVYALPWHLGRHAWAAEHLLKQEQCTEAAYHYAVASEQETRHLQQRISLAELAIQNWRQAGRAILAACFRDSLPYESDQAKAQEYENAANLTPREDDAIAASLFRRAAELYELADSLEKAHDCTRKAGKLSHAPYLSIRMVSIFAL